MKNQFIKIQPTSGSEKWLNVDNIVSIEECNSGIRIITNATRDNHPVHYTVKSSVCEFLSAISCEEMAL